MPSLKVSLSLIYNEFIEYVETALLYDDCDLDSFATYANNHYQIDPVLATSWEYLYA